MKRSAHPGFTQEANGTWTFVADVPGPEGKRKQTRRRGFPTLKAAKVARAELVRAVARSEYVVPSKLTFGDYLARWLEGHRSQVKASTIASYETHVEHYVRPRLGGLPLQSISAGTLSSFYGELLAHGSAKHKNEPLAAATVQRVHATVRKALADATNEGLILQNPALKAKVPGGKAAAHTEMRTWSAADVGKFLEVARGERLYAAFVVALGVGTRRGETLGLRWGDVDLDARRAVVRQTIVILKGTISRDTPKSHKARTVALGDEVVAALRARRKAQLEERMAAGPAWEDEDLIFTAPTGGPVNPDLLTDTWDRLVKASGVPRIRLHDARHTFASLSLAAGVPVLAVSRALGHATPGFTLSVYGHLTDEMAGEASERSSAAIFGRGRV